MPSNSSFLVPGWQEKQKEIYEKKKVEGEEAYLQQLKAVYVRAGPTRYFFFFFTLVTGPRRSLSLPDIPAVVGMYFLVYVYTTI